MASTRTTSTVDLVDDLLSRVPDLLSLHVVSQAVVDDACARLSGSAAVVLVKDGEAHGVTAGVGLRPLELRLQLGSDHWLVREVVVAGHGLVVEDTDIARRDLVGAPLAAAQHLVAVPVPAIGGLVMVARDGHGVAFSHTDLATLARLAAEAGPPLREALALRDLARGLNDLDE